MPCHIHSRSPPASHLPGDQSTRSALSSEPLGETGQATLAPTPAQPPTGRPGRDAKAHGDGRDLAPLCSQQDQGLETGAAADTRRLLVTQPLSGKKPFA